MISLYSILLIQARKATIKSQIEHRMEDVPERCGIPTAYYSEKVR